MIELVIFLVFVTATPSEPSRYKEGEKAYRASELKRATESVLARLDGLIEKRALCTSGVTYIGLREWPEQAESLTLAVETMCARGWNMSLRNVTLAGYTKDSILVSKGPCLIDQCLEPLHCYRSLDQCGNVLNHLVFDGEWWLGCLICYQTVQLLHVTL